VKKNNVQWLILAILTLVFVVGCAGPTAQYRQEETFFSPYGGSAIKIGASGSSNNYGTMEKGFISYHPFNEGAIVTLVDEEETIEDNPNLDPRCNNYKGQLKRKVRKIFRHQIIMQSQVVYAWNDKNENWWAVGLTALAGHLIDRGIDAAFLYTMPTGDVNIAGGSVGNVSASAKQKQGQKSINKNANINKNKNINPININNKAISGSSSAADAKVINPKGH